ncbi:MAG: acyl carrier protein [Aurantibacter sp.]
MTDISEAILQYIEANIAEDEPDGELDKSDNLFESGILDSFGMMKLVNFIERKFNIQIPFGDVTVENFMNVEKINDYIAHKVNS